MKERLPLQLTHVECKITKSKHLKCDGLCHHLIVPKQGHYNNLKINSN